MRRCQFLAGLLLLPMAASAQDAPLFNFPVETVHSDAEHYVETVHAVGTGWFASGTRPQDYRMGTAPTEGALEPQAFIIKSRPDEQHDCSFGTMMQMHPPGPFLGKRLRLSARLKSEEVRRAQLWLRVDGKNTVETGRSLSFYNMDDRPVRGTTDWRHFEFVLDVPDDAVAIAYGFFVTDGHGTAWMDGLTLETVGKDVPVTRAGRSIVENCDYRR